jgi:two-component system, NtrC family, C4-dicarboxylate transport sensor histidine kinase DctB
MDELYKESKELILNMSSTIEDFSNFFNPQKEKKSFEIKEAVNEALMLLRKVIENESINLQIDVPINYKVLGVSNELSQVIINLIQNSKDAFILNNIKNKRITITLKEEDILDKKYSMLEISDNAGGINKENIDKIFEPYFTTKHKSQGTGLGLFMSKMIIEKSLDGQLTHRNTKDGSIFTIKLVL